MYASLRLGIYFNINDYLTKQNDGKAPGAGAKALASLFAGAVGAAIANPCDLALVRMQADSSLPIEQRRNYRNVFHAFSTILKEEGFINLYRGCSPTVARAMSLNLSMLVTYDITKAKLEEHYGKSNLTLFLATFVSGTFVSIASLPFDNMKTKLQKQTKDKDGNYMYKNLRDCALKSYQREGFFGYWTGLPTFYFRVAPHAMFTLIFSEIYKKLFGLTK